MQVIDQLAVQHNHVLLLQMDRSEYRAGGSESCRRERTSFWLSFRAMLSLSISSSSSLGLSSFTGLSLFVAVSRAACAISAAMVAGMNSLPMAAAFRQAFTCASHMQEFGNYTKATR